MDAEVLRRNAQSRERLRAIVARLDDPTFHLSLHEGWTVAATLAHLAFWDHSNLVRWDAFARDGAFPGISDEMETFINACSLPLWRAVPGQTAAAMALEAAEAVDLAAAALPPDALAYIEKTHRSSMLDHARHRHAHLDEIEAALIRHGASVSS
jgi:hypothetical protein